MTLYNHITLSEAGVLQWAMSVSDQFGGMILDNPSIFPCFITLFTLYLFLPCYLLYYDCRSILFLWEICRPQLTEK